MASLAFLAAPPASGVIVLGDGDPNVNAFDVNPPAGPLRNSGGQFQGYFGGFAATPIGPHHFIAASHIGQPVGSVFTFRGINYTALNPSSVTGSDFLIWQVNETFPIWAPLFIGGGPVGPYDPMVPDPPGFETGRPLVAWGNGRKRGTAITGETFQGWPWGEADFRLRWGVNVVADTVRDSGGFHGSYVHATFDAAGGLGDFECHLAEFDSSGAMFIREAGVWKLAGIHYAVDTYYLDQTGPGTLTAFLFDARGLWEDVSGGGRSPIAGSAPVPSGFYSTRISAYLPAILQIIGSSSAAITTFPQWQSACFTPAEITANTEAAATADPEGDGLPNLAEYAFGAAPFAPSAEVRPTASIVTVSSQRYAAISYRRARGLTDVTYAVEVSSDLQNWSSGTGTSTLISDTPDGDTNLVVVRDNTPLGSGVLRRSLRVRVTQP